MNLILKKNKNSITYGLYIERDLIAEFVWIGSIAKNTIDNIYLNIKEYNEQNQSKEMKDFYIECMPLIVDTFKRVSKKKSMTYLELSEDKFELTIHSS